MERALVDISDVVANIQMRPLKAEVNLSHASDSGRVEGAPRSYAC